MSNARRLAAKIATEGRQHHGAYVVLEETPEGNLKMSLTEDGRREAEEVRGRPEEDALADLLEDHFGAGWEWVAPEEIGALTSAMILTNDAVRDEQGELVRLDRVYWDPQYQVRSTVEGLIDDGEVVWQGVDAEDAEH